MEQLPTPESRKELYLSNIAGTGAELPKEPWSREEQYLNYIAVNGGGSSDFDKAKNRPKYNNETMSSATNIPEVPSDLVQIIPNQASPTNQLADKNFVNSSIATSTADFMGTFNSLEELEAVQGANDNDYGFVVSKDSAGNTLYNRYKYSGTEWLFEYTLNNSSFTAEQWAAIQSGITSGGVAKLNGLANIKTIGDGLSLNTDTGTLNNTNENVALYDTIGQNTDGAMTQKAVTSELYAPNNYQTDRTAVRIGWHRTSEDANQPQYSVQIGLARARGHGSLAINAANNGTNAAYATNSVAIGAGAQTTANATGSVSFGGNVDIAGVFSIQPFMVSSGYNNSNYRLLTGVYDGQSANDAVNVGQINALIDAINAAASLSIPHIGAGE